MLPEYGYVFLHLWTDTVGRSVRCGTVPWRHFWQSVGTRALVNTLIFFRPTTRYNNFEEKEVECVLPAPFQVKNKIKNVSVARDPRNFTCALCTHSM